MRGGPLEWRLEEVQHKIGKTTQPKREQQLDRRQVDVQPMKRFNEMFILSVHVKPLSSRYGW